MSRISRDELRALNAPGDLTADLAAALAPDPARTVVVYCSGPACGRLDAGLPLEGARRTTVTR